MKQLEARAKQTVLNRLSADIENGKLKLDQFDITTTGLAYPKFNHKNQGLEYSIEVSDYEEENVFDLCLTWKDVIYCFEIDKNPECPVSALFAAIVEKVKGAKEEWQTAQDRAKFEKLISEF